MKTFSKIALIFLLLFSFTTSAVYTANDPSNAEMNLQTGDESNKNTAVEKNTHLKNMENSDNDFSTSKGGEKGIHNSIIKIALDLKNLFFGIAGVYFLIIVLKLIFSGKTEEEVSNFKKGLIWISVGIIITQISYYFVSVLFDKSINTGLAENFIDIILKPLINLLQALTSFIFLAVMIYAFFRIVSANGDEEKAKSGKMSVLYAMVGFMIVKLSNALIDTIYGETYCFSHVCKNRDQVTDLEGFAEMLVKIIDWANGFVGIIVILLTIYAGFLVLTSVGDEEKLKKAKNIIIYIAVGLTVLIANYLILTFFINA